MRLTIFCFVLLIGCGLSKTVTKALTESMGQEVIEIGAPLKDLPAELEEEPSLEKDDDDTSKASVAAATKRDAPKTLAPAKDGRRKLKDIDRIDSVNQEEDEQRVEKELADVYKDSNADYKAESNEVKASVEADNSLRQRSQKSDFVFAPRDINDPKQVERFRTSPDYIDCKKRKLIDPNLNNANEVERFKTSLDGLACDKKKLNAFHNNLHDGRVYSVDKNETKHLLLTDITCQFQFQPDLSNPDEVARFKTSPDIIDCHKKLNPDIHNKDEVERFLTSTDSIACKRRHKTRGHVARDQITTPSLPKRAPSTLVNMALVAVCTAGIIYYYNNN